MATTDATPIPIKNQAYHIGFPILDADGDLVTGAGSLDSEVSTDSGGFGDCSNEAVEEATNSGMYELLLTDGEMNGDIVMVIVISSAGKTTPIVLYPQEAGDIKVDVESVSGDTSAADNLELFFDGTGYDAANSEVGTVASVTAIAANGIAANSFAAGAIDATAIANGAIDAATFAANAINAAAIDADAIDLIWDEPASGHTTLATFGQVFNALGVFTGEVNDGAASAADFDTDGFTEASDNHLNGMIMVFTTGALKGQANIITTYTGSGQNCAFATNWTEAPTSNDDFVIVPGGYVRTPGTAQILDDLNDISTADVNTQALDVINTDTFSEPGGVPAASASVVTMLHWLYTIARNRLTQTATTQTLRNDANDGSISTAAVSDDGTTAVRDEWA